MTRHILIVEDDLFVLQLYEFAFSKSEFTIDTAVDGEIAIQKATTQKYDAILLDIMLPKVNGMDVLRKIRTTENTSKKTPIILATNLAEDATMQEAKDLGANGYILKADSEPMDIVKKITEVLSAKTP